VLSAYILLCMVRNKLKVDNKTKNKALEVFNQYLPKGWKVSAIEKPNKPPFSCGIKVTATDKESNVFAVCFRRNLTPRTTEDLIEGLEAKKSENEILVMSPYLSPGVCGFLEDSSINYLDFTGNIRIQVFAPALYISSQGAQKNPDRKKRPSRSLRGEKAGQIARMLIDSKQLLGVREIAEKIDIDPGYVSRVLKLLDREALIERDKRGCLLSVDWQKLLKRWAEDAPLESRGDNKLFLAARGLLALESKLKSYKKDYAITASLAAAKIAPVAPTRLATIYVEDYERAATYLDLREVDAGANVLLIEPNDETILSSAIEKEELRYVNVSQAALDLLTGPGRSQAEAEELIEWMAKNEDTWRG
jgi:hypothetical protein